MTLKHKQKTQRQHRVRMKLTHANDLPRLSVFRSNKHIFAQLIDDAKQITLFGVSDKTLPVEEKTTKTDRAVALGKRVAEMAKEKKIAKIKFDKGSYRYHGRVKAVAEGAREGGLEF